MWLFPKHVTLMVHFAQGMVGARNVSSSRRKTQLVPWDNREHEYPTSSASLSLVLLPMDDPGADRGSSAMLENVSSSTYRFFQD